MSRKLDDIVIGRVVAPLGIRGEVKVVVLTDFPQRLNAGGEITLKLADGKRRTALIDAGKPYKDGMVLKLRGISTRDDAELLRQAEIVIGEQDLGELEDGRFYLFDVIGLAVVTQEGRELGEVTEVLQGGANDVYVTSAGVCIPALKDVVIEVDVSGGRMLIRAVPGLLPD